MDSGEDLEGHKCAGALPCGCEQVGEYCDSLFDEGEWDDILGSF